MSPFLALATVLVAQAQTGGQVPMLKPLTVDETNRLALTPTIDGEIQPGEWEQLADSGSGTTYFQWEPDTLYFAGKASIGDDIVASFDLGNDGWLVGSDNVELRCHLEDGKLKVTVRRLDASDPAGPKWVPGTIEPETLHFAVKQGDSTWSLEAAYDVEEKDVDIKEGTKIGARVDILPETTDLSKPYLPRTMSFVRLQYDNSDNLFSGVTWRPVLIHRSFAREDEFRVRYEFQEDPDGPSLKSFEVEGQGRAASILTKIRNPFPALDRNGHARIDYVTKVAPGATPGYRIVRGTLTAADGREAYVYTSVRIADLVDIDVNIPLKLAAKDDAQIVRGGVTYKSQAVGRISGVHSFTVPAGWTISRGEKSNLVIYRTRGQERIAIEFIVPRGARGVFPIHFEARIGDRTITKTAYIKIQ